VKEAIFLTGGMESVVDKGDKVYLKPNFVAPRESKKGVTTDMEIIRVVADEVRRCGGLPILYETPATEFDKESVYNILGVRDFARKNGINLVDGSVEMIRVPVPGGKVLKSIQIPRMLHKAKILNLPKLKTHVSAKMTCGMKNLIGLLPDPEKRRVHVRGVHASIADISRVFRPVLTVVDATTCMHGDGPTYGDPIEVGLIIAGKDPLSVDKIGSQVMGLAWQDVKYIHLFDGSTDGKEIQVVGAPPTETRAPFVIPEKSLFYHTSTWLIHTLDIVFSRLFPQHLNEFLFHTGYLGTNPEILREKCDQCGECLKICPVKDAMRIDVYKVDYKKCIRCLRCYEGCRQHAIAVKGFSRPEDS
jgi:uncharacterized protein (DUF362 family)/ferredoxin